LPDKKQSQSFDKLRTGLPAFGRKLEILNPKSETYGFSKEKNGKQFIPKGSQFYDSFKTADLNS
jgi:hypothetical protein